MPGNGLGHDNDRKYPEPETLFDDYSGRGLAERDQDMTIEKTMTPRDVKLVAPRNLTPEQREKWDAYYEPRNKKFREAELTGKDLVRWRYQRYMHDSPRKHGSDSGRRFHDGQEQTDRRRQDRHAAAHSA